MSYPINYPTPQKADVQIFYAPVRPVTTAWTAEWVKPQGASFVWFTLIGAGGGGASTDGVSAWRDGGTGAVSNCLVPAFLVPDVLQIRVGKGGTGAAPGGIDGGAGTDTIVFYQQKATTGYALLTANGGGGGIVSGPTNGGASSAGGPFGSLGIYQSIDGASGTNTTPSTTTFLGAADANYGYSATVNGFFQMQPIIVSTVGQSNYPTSPTVQGNGGIGCGGASVPGVASLAATGVGGNGGDGLAVIISW